MSERKPNGSGPEAETEAPPQAAENGAPKQEAPEAAPDRVELSVDETDAEIPSVVAEDPVARLEVEVASLKDQLLRSLAELENVRRRAKRERDDAVKYAAAPLAKDLLAVADNLNRALASVPENPGGGGEALAQLVAGLKLTEKELETAFERHHIVKLDPLGEKLDPHRHEAMFEMPDPNRPAGTIAQVMEPGYLLHDRLLRAARVGVAKGGPAAQAEKAPEAPAEEAQPAEAESQPESKAEPEVKPEPGSRIDTEA